MLRRSKEEVAERQIAAEIQQGMDHLRTAAAMATARAAERMSPAMRSARMTAMETVMPRMMSARQMAGRAWRSARRPLPEEPTGRMRGMMQRRKARKARKTAMEGLRMQRLLQKEPPKRSRWRWMMGALGIGAAVGIVGAMISKRRAPQWEEYETSSGMAASQSSGGARQKVTDMADAARRKTGQAMETAKEKMQAARGRGGKHEAGRTTEPGMSGSTMSEPVGTGPTSPTSSRGERPPTSF